ncbi:MAG: restriction endonuclease [Arachnia propionica]|uniref:restriction endonuclease n=1 Tax=Arachnia propionica TaxID=1750 RepID=UPI0026F6AE54|nr:restriction endonuclease [Arachnia propionica]
MFNDVVAGIWDSVGGVLAPVLWVGAVLLGTVAVVWVVTLLARTIRRLQATRELGVRIPRGFRVRRARPERDQGTFVLAYPRWQVARKDGTRNRRYRTNEVVEDFSTLELGRWRLSSRSVMRFYDLVVALRGRGHVIALSGEEAEKLALLNEQEGLRVCGASRNHIYHRFAAEPTRFEQFCAELYRELGHRVEVTPPIADGGFDLRMFGPGGKTLVECKCFHPAQSVGRPVLQKLFGAGAVEGADRLLVVTTATFSKEALAYAEAVGMDLVDGDALVTLCDRAWGCRPPAQGPTVQEVQLTLEDHLAHMPADIRERYAALV